MAKSGYNVGTDSETLRPNISMYKSNGRNSAYICKKSGQEPVYHRYGTEHGRMVESISQRKGRTTCNLTFCGDSADGNELYVANLRTAKSTDVYIPERDGSFKWEPLFVYHGFRFVEVSGLDYTPSVSDFTGKIIYDRMKTIGSFECSNALLNQIYTNAYWGIRGNYRGMPTDCPQRDERMGWLGDRTTGAHGESFIFDNALLYNKWLMDIQQSITPEGVICDVSPCYWKIYEDDVTWPAAYFYIADMLHTQFGDDAAIRIHYSEMKNWVEREQSVDEGLHCA